MPCLAFEGLQSVARGLAYATQTWGVGGGLRDRPVAAVARQNLRRALIEEQCVWLSCTTGCGGRYAGGPGWVAGGVAECSRVGRGRRVCWPLATRRPGHPAWRGVAYGSPARVWRQGMDRAGAAFSARTSMTQPELQRLPVPCPGEHRQRDEMRGRQQARRLSGRQRPCGGRLPLRCLAPAWYLLGP